MDNQFCDDYDYSNLSNNYSPFGNQAPSQHHQQQQHNPSTNVKQNTSKPNHNDSNNSQSYFGGQDNFHSSNYYNDSTGFESFQQSKNTDQSQMHGRHSNYGHESGSGSMASNLTMLSGHGKTHSNISCNHSSNKNFGNNHGGRSGGNNYNNNNNNNNNTNNMGPYGNNYNNATDYSGGYYEDMDSQEYYNESGYANSGYQGGASYDNLGYGQSFNKRSRLNREGESAGHNAHIWSGSYSNNNNKRPPFRGGQNNYSGAQSSGNSSHQPRFSGRGNYHRNRQNDYSNQEEIEPPKPETEEQQKQKAVDIKIVNAAALNCKICGTKKFATVSSYQDHLTCMHHRRLFVEMEEENKAFTSMLRHYSKVAVYQHEARRTSRISGRPFPQETGFCFICQCIVYGPQKAHQKTIEHKQVHSFLNLSCCGEDFLFGEGKNRSDIERHLLTPMHLHNIYEAKDKSEEEATTTEPEVQSESTSNKEDELPRKSVMGNDDNKQYKYKELTFKTLKHYGSNVELGMMYISKRILFKCHICTDYILPSTGGAIDHCHTHGHYDKASTVFRKKAVKKLEDGEEAEPYDSDIVIEVEDDAKEQEETMEVSEI